MPTAKKKATNKAKAKTTKRKTSPKNKGGRPSRYQAEFAEQAYKLCLLGATDKKMADFFGVSEQTLNTWKKRHKEFLESLKKGKEIADSEIASSLFHRAKGYEHEEVKVFQSEGGIIQSDPITKHYPPDTTAAIFWLKNRQPNIWRDRKENVNLEVDQDIEVIYKKGDE